VRLPAAILAAAILAAACGPAVAPPSALPARAALAGVDDEHLVASNILRGDYAGSASCAPCHAAIYARWSASPMRRMTRLASDTVPRAPFDGARLDFKGDSVTTEEHAGRRYMRVVTQKNGTALYRVTKVIGGRYREDFAGYEVAGTEEGALPVGNPHLEPVLPASYLIFAKQWRYKGYSVMVKERPYIDKGGAPWRQTCIFCHNTTPYLTTIYDDLAPRPQRAYQGSISDHLLPKDRQWELRPGDAAGLGAALATEIAYLQKKPAKAAGGGTDELLGEALKVTAGRFDESHLVEVGIGCEACHNGSREHVAEPRRLPSLVVQSSLVKLATPTGAAPTRAESVNHVCARCHTVLFSRYPYTWEGGLRSGDAGGSTINSGEARDLLLGGCAAQLACTACHDPHGEDSREKLDTMGTVAGNPLCLGCHAKYEGKAALAAHTHHATDGQGSACLACHMPRKNTGLGYRLTRYHRIGSPTDRARVEKDRPLECALCHADKPASELVAKMESWWNKSYDRRTLTALHGDLAESSIVSTLLRGKPHEQMTAAAVLGERGKASQASLLVPLLSSEYPLARYHARTAIESLVGKPMPIGLDLDGDADTIQRSSMQWLKTAVPPGP
jgi:predicted CXXCH cytochrome family protein